MGQSASNSLTNSQPSLSSPSRISPTSRSRPRPPPNQNSSSQQHPTQRPTPIPPNNTKNPSQNAHQKQHPPTPTFPYPHKPSLSTLLPPSTLPQHISPLQIRSLARSFRRTTALLSHSSNDGSTSSSDCSTLETTDETTDIDTFLHLLTSTSSAVPPLANRLASSPLARGLDKPSFGRYLLPPHALPPGGVLDCLFHALAVAPSTPSVPQVHLTDLLIFIAIFKSGSLKQKSTLAFRIYDSYLKKGVVTRDTFKRFIAAVYGTELAEGDVGTAILDELGTTASDTTDVTISEATFVATVTEGSLLLTWLESLSGILGESPQGIIQIYRQYVPKRTGAATMIRELRKKYKLTRVGLFETRRKFHSLAEECAERQKETVEGLRRQGFVSVLGQDSEEMGNGGFLCQRMAELVYDWGSEKEGDEGLWDLKRVLEFGCRCVRGDTREIIWEVLRDVRTMCDVLPRQYGWRRRRDYRELSGEEGAWEGRDAVELGMVGGEEVTLDDVVKSVLESVGVEREEDFGYEEFVRWGEGDVKRRVGPFLMEFRLVASVVFGVRPLTPIMEFEIVQEIIHRHKLRYPTSPSSRRGDSGTVWYILSTLWWKKWVDYANSVVEKADTNSVPQPPSEIENNLLLKDGSLALKPNIKFHVDFELIPPLAYTALQAWHDGGPPINRTVVHRPTTTPPTAEIELYPFFLNITLADSSSGTPRPFQQWAPVSRILPVGLLVENLKKMLKQDNPARLWRVGGGGGEEGNKDVVLDLKLSLGEQSEGIDDGDTLMLELMIDGEWCIPSSSQQSKQLPTTTTTTPHVGDGVMGLYNMGNTCYLNSSIQCLSHTPLLREYFTSKVYLRDINTTNPLGHQGGLARVCAQLINQLWKPHSHTQTTSFVSRKSLGNNDAVSSHQSSSTPAQQPLPVPNITPKGFKDAIGKFNDHFAGNEQHDAQELLAYLLSGLSEDLNRIESKPYIEQPDSDGRPDEELADIWWKNHLLREMSIIVTLFTGQYKSLLTCRVCKYESARFEPFAFLQLPLPEDNLMTLNVIVYPIEETQEVLKYSVRVVQDGTIYDALVRLSKMMYEDEGVWVGDDEEEEEEEGERKEEGEGESVSSVEKEKREEGRRMCMKRANNMAVVDVRDCRILSITPPTRSISQVQLRDTGDIPLLYVYELDPLPVNGTETETEVVPNNTTEDEDDDDNESSALSQTNDDDESRKDATESTKDEETTTEDDTTAEGETAEGETAEGETAPQPADAPPDSSSTHSSSSLPKPLLPQTRPSYIAIAQRKLDPVSRPHLFPYTLRTFSTPLLLRVLDLEGYTGADLYDLVAKRINRFQALPLTLEDEEEEEESPTTTEPTTEATTTTAAAADTSTTDSTTNNPQQPSPLSPRRRDSRTPTPLSDPTVCGGRVPRYGFRLRLASRDGKRCSLCPWYDCCVGCLVADDDYPTIVQDGDTIALDWHLCVKTDDAADMDDIVENHASCKDGSYAYGGSITLEECLDAFAKEEKIPEAFCSKCKEFNGSTKRMSIWRLPPVMIIHLKRFQFTQHMRRKLRNLVVFPVEGLDLSRIVCGPTGPMDDEKKNENGETCSSSSSSYTPTTSLYDLYGVIHHQGALSGGHYVASIKSEIDNKWRLFNDAQVYTIGSRDIVDATAYILFYVRRDVKDASMADFWDISERDGEGVTEEQIDKLVKSRERCVIS